MHQSQLTHLLTELNQLSYKKYSLHRLLNNIDYRNNCLQTEKRRADSQVLLMINQIQALEDLLAHELRVDLLTHIKQQKQLKPRWGLAVLAFSGLLFIAVSVFAVEQIKHHRHPITSLQAD